MRYTCSSSTIMVGKEACSQRLEGMNPPTVDCSTIWRYLFHSFLLHQICFRSSHCFLAPEHVIVDLVWLFSTSHLFHSLPPTSYSHFDLPQLRLSFTLFSERSEFSPRRAIIIKHSAHVVISSCQLREHLRKRSCHRRIISHPLRRFLS